MHVVDGCVWDGGCVGGGKRERCVRRGLVGFLVKERLAYVDSPCVKSLVDKGYTALVVLNAKNNMAYCIVSGEGGGDGDDNRHVSEVAAKSTFSFLPFSDTRQFAGAITTRHNGRVHL